MKFKFLIAILLTGSVVFTSCDDDEVVLGNWVEQAFFEGQARANGTSFSLDGKGYFGMGQNADDYFADFWQYSPDKNAWTQVASFPGTPRAFGVSVNTGSKGYAGLGYDGTNDLSDFWEYNATTNAWTQVDDMQYFDKEKNQVVIVPRRHASAFAIGEDVYVGLGSQDKNKIYFNDFYKLSGGKWDKIASFGGQKRIKAQAFSINNKGYVVSGLGNANLNDMWSYDPTTDTWTRQSNRIDDEDNNGLSIAIRNNATVFVAENKMYMAFGSIGSNNVVGNSVVEWDPATGVWTEKNGLENSLSREAASSFVIEGKPYIVGGRNSNSFYYDTYSFEPSKERDIED